MELHSPIDTQSLLAMIEQEAQTPGPKVTIYFSVPASSDFAILGRAELKADIHSVGARLERMHTPEEQYSAILKHLRSLIDSSEFWKNRSESYVIFASASFLRYYALPLPVHGNVWVGGDFQITPLIPLLSLPEHFYLLEVTQHMPRLAKVHPHLAVSIPLDAVWEFEVEQVQDEPVHGRSFHTASAKVSPGHTEGGIIPHAGAQDGGFRKRDRMLKVLAQEVDKLLQPTGQTLLLTGASELVQHFRTYLTYPHVLISSERISFPKTNPIDSKTNLWLLFAKQIIKASGQEQDTAAQVESLRAEGRVAESLESILSLSSSGGVMRLIVNERALQERNDPIALDRINAALVMTLKNHGTAQETSSPSNTGVLAVLRPGWKAA